MATLIYSAICSLDLYINDAGGSFEWAAPDEQVHAFVNEQQRPVGTYLLGRGTYDTLKVWDTFGSDPEESDAVREFASIWRSADKVVYSATLGDVETARTRIERDFDPVVVRAMVDAAERDVSVGGARLGATALRAGIVGRVELYLTPVVVGGGTRALPDDVRLGLELLATERFDHGVVYLSYALRGSRAD
ncbi:dihydrofolate reductase family protein [Nocardioides sp. GXQ0305]|uniref:dihydrofolate reductase family protein n=1 Tax=Nocardioides sp. GXQ0305 TaxID=3423912 RepID=UPI003D7D3439